MFKDFTKEEFLEEYSLEDCPSNFGLEEDINCLEGADEKQCERCWENAIKNVEFKNPVDIFYEKHVTILDDLAIAERQYQSIKEERDSLKEEMLKAMEVYGVTKFENDVFSINYVKGSTGVTFDTKAFKESYPELYKEFCKPSVRSASVRFKVK